MEVIPLSQGSFAVGDKKDFHPVDEKISPSGITIAVRPFLVITQHDVILLDTGLELNANGDSVLLESLKNHRIRPQQITKILLSHLHKDHIGGIGHFPQAEIYIQQRELDFALTQQGNPSFDFQQLDELKTLSNVVRLDEDKGSISKQIIYEVSGGHSPYHQQFWINENDQTIFYGGDNLPKESYLRLQVAYKSDYNGKKAMELRQLWKERARKEDWKVLFYHDLETPFLNY